jgi:hypothetical protein
MLDLRHKHPVREQDMEQYVYELWHYKIASDEEPDDDKSPKDIGIYSSEDTAKAAIQRLKEMPGFRDWPGGWRIFRAIVDKDSWVDGFISSDDA